MRFFQYMLQNRGQVGQYTLEHIELVGLSISLAVMIGFPLGIVMTRYRRFSGAIMAVVNVTQTIPSLAMFGFLLSIPFVGLGVRNAVVALLLYSLLPIVRNTYTGISHVDPAILEAARGMGMTDWQLLWKVEVPLALGVIFAGVRVATVIAIGLATIAAFVGAGGLGRYIVRGLSMVDHNLILAGAVPAALMALIADFGLGRIERRWRRGFGNDRGGE